MEKEKILEELYYSPKTGYRSTEHLWKLAKEEGEKYDVSISKNFVKEWLQRQATYTRFKKWNNPKHYRHTFVRDFDHVQADLIELSMNERDEGYRFIFVAIEILSRTAFAYPQKSKSGDDSIENMKKLIVDFEKRFDKKFKSLQSDEGVEFASTKVKEFYKDEDIIWYASKSPRAASIAERFIRTLRTKMRKMYHYEGDYRWVDNLGKLVENYNDSEHRSIGMKPDEVNEENKHTVWLRLFGHIVNIGKPKFKVGDKVRISRFGDKNTRYREMQVGLYFKRKYEKRDEGGRVKREGKNLAIKGLIPFSKEIFEVSKVMLGDPIVYKLYSEEAGYELFGIFYTEELSLVRE